MDFCVLSIVHVAKVKLGVKVTNIHVLNSQAFSLPKLAISKEFSLVFGYYAWVSSEKLVVLLSRNIISFGRSFDKKLGNFSSSISNLVH